MAEPLLVLEMRFVGTAPALRDLLGQRLEEALRAGGLTILHPAPSTGAPTHCPSGPCLAEVARGTNTTLALDVGVVGQGSSYDVTLTLLETGAGSVVAQVTARCDVCTFEEAAATAAQGVSSLQEQARRVIASQAWLIVESTPAAAQVRLDGVPVGATPLRRLVPAGTHRVTVEHPEAGSWKDTIKLAPNRARTVSVNLARPGPGSAQQASSRKRADPLGIYRWIAFGSSLALTGAGTAALALNNPCRNPPDCDNARHTLAVGLSLTSAGLLGTLLAGYWLWSAPQPADPGPSFGVAPLRRGFALVLTHRSW